MSFLCSGDTNQLVILVTPGILALKSDFGIGDP